MILYVISELSERRFIMIGYLIGNLKIISKIGEGGMGAVYLAENVKLGNQFAVKSLAIHLVKNQLFRERFSREAKAQTRLEHQNIAKIIDFIKRRIIFI